MVEIRPNTTNPPVTIASASQAHDLWLTVVQTRSCHERNQNVWLNSPPPTNFVPHILKSNFPASSEHFSRITVHRCIHRTASLKQWKVKKEVRRGPRPHTYIEVRDCFHRLLSFFSEQLSVFVFSSCQRPRSHGVLGVSWPHFFQYSVHMRRLTPQFCQLFLLRPPLFVATLRCLWFLHYFFPSGSERPAFRLSYRIIYGPQAHGAHCRVAQILMLTRWRRLCRILWPRASRSSAELVRWARDVAEDDDDVERSSTTSSSEPMKLLADTEQLTAAAAAEDGVIMWGSAAARCDRSASLTASWLGDGLSVGRLCQQSVTTVHRGAGQMSGWSSRPPFNT